MTDTKYIANITLTQKGTSGPIETTTNLAPKGGDFTPAVFQEIARLTARWLEMKSMHEPEEVEDSAPTYHASFTLTQEGIDGDIFAKLTLNPKIKHDDTSYPDCYEAMSALSTLYLIDAGVINEEGELIDEEKLHNSVTLEAKEQTLH